MDHYEVIGVARTASITDINAGARDALWAGKVDQARTRQILNAWFTLRDPQRRRAYDQQLIVEAPGLPTVTGPQPTVPAGTAPAPTLRGTHRQPRHRA